MSSRQPSEISAAKIEIQIDNALYENRLNLIIKMSQKQIPARPYTRKKIQNFSYGLSEIIGKGYSSQVFKGRNDQTDEPVAVKVIDLKMLKCEINRTLLSSEIEILKSLRNVPHILSLHQVYTTKNNTYIITELCDTDLSHKIKKKLTEPEAFYYMAQFLSGYSYVYEKQLIHRDLKPANLLITHDNEIKIADFGFGIKAQQVLKPSKYNVGSPLYMPPESLRRNEYSFKSDIWAIGIIFYEMLTCDTPWRGKSQKDLLKKIQGEKIQTILARKDFSPMSREFLSRALTRDKNHRLDPEELLRFNFKKPEGSILTEKKLNSTFKPEKFISIIDKALSPKNALNIELSTQKKVFRHEGSEKKIQLLNKAIGNYCTNNTENTAKKIINSPNHDIELPKEQKKHISKILIAQVHFCRFLYKLLGRIKESVSFGILSTPESSQFVTEIFMLFTCIIKHKIIQLKDFGLYNFLGISKHEAYTQSTDFKKLLKIAKDYNDRYSGDLKVYWSSSENYSISTEEVRKLIQFILSQLQEKVSDSDNIEVYSKDIIILDYLMTCKQLLDMIKDGENYQKFAKKSRIQEIVEGSTGQISYQLYLRIIDRANSMFSHEKNNCIPHYPNGLIHF